jgi:hypothetical protein
LTLTNTKIGATFGVIFAHKKFGAVALGVGSESLLTGISRNTADITALI